MRVLFYYSGAEHLGLECLFSTLTSKGHTVELIFDPGLGSNFFLNLPFLNKLSCSDAHLLDKAKRFNPDLIAFSCITNQYATIKKLAGKMKELLKVPIITGGIHPTSVPEEVISENCFDIVCIGEGEEAMLELLEKMEKKESILNIRNLWVKDKGGTVHKNELRPLVKDLDKLPFSDKSLFHKYGVINTRIMVMTARGCPFKCSFCLNSFINDLNESGKFLRRRSVDNVIEELVQLKSKYNPTAFRFEDDVFAFNLKWLREFGDKYTEHINLPFHCYLTPSTAKDSILRELKRTGCESVSMGIQSGNEKIRREILKRRHSNDDIIEAAQRIKKYGFKLISEFIFGFPTETPRQMWESVELNEKLDVYSTASFIFYPFPKTELAEYCLKNGYLTQETMDDIIKTGKGSYHLACLLDHPYKDDIYKFNSILPVYAKAPKFIKLLLRLSLNMKYSMLHKLIYIISIPLIDFDEFCIRIVDIPKQVIKTRKVLSS